MAWSAVNRAISSPSATFKSAAAATRTSGRAVLGLSVLQAAPRMHASKPYRMRFTNREQFNMIPVESYVTFNRSSGGGAAGRRVFDTQAVDLSGTRPHSRHEWGPPSHPRSRGRSIAGAVAHRVESARRCTRPHRHHRVDQRA